MLFLTNQMFICLQWFWEFSEFNSYDIAEMLQCLLKTSWFFVSLYTELIQLLTNPTCISSTFNLSLTLSTCSMISSFSVSKPKIFQRIMVVLETHLVIRFLQKLVILIHLSQNIILYEYIKIWVHFRTLVYFSISKSEKAQDVAL